MSEKGFRTSTEVASLYEALSAAQGEFPVVEKSKTGKVQGASKSTGKEYSYTYKYADIADVFKAVLPVLSKHKLCVVQPTCLIGDVMNIVTHLAHSSGQWIESDYPVCTISGDHQRMAGALTYAKRQAACALVGIVADEDTDGVEAEVPAPKRPPVPPRPDEQLAKSNALMLEMMTEIRKLKNRPESVAWAGANEGRKAFLFTAHADAVS